ncbi:MAG: phosphatase PAP2 family protein [Phycisphaerales bacterium]|nr:phosphatase PAP2 family protein [Phycisphaerales bacterium]
MAADLGDLAWKVFRIGHDRIPANRVERTCGAGTRPLYQARRRGLSVAAVTVKMGALEVNHTLTSSRRPFRRDLPTSRPMTRARLWRGGAVAMFCIAIVAAMTRYDVSIVRWLGQYPTLKTHPFADAARSLAEFWVMSAVIILIALSDRRAVLVICHVLFAAYLGFNLAHLGKIFIHRERPYIALARPPEEAASLFASWRGIELDVRRKASRNSFPSAHTTNAFAVAVTLAWFYPRMSALFLLLATACACSRIVQHAHWPSDCMAGVVIGVVAAWLSLHVRALTMPRRWFRRKSGGQSPVRPEV